MMGAISNELYGVWLTTKEAASYLKISSDRLLNMAMGGWRYLKTVIHDLRVAMIDEKGGRPV